MFNFLFPNIIRAAVKHCAVGLGRAWLLLCAVLWPGFLMGRPSATTQPLLQDPLSPAAACFGFGEARSFSSHTVLTSPFAAPVPLDPGAPAPSSSPKLVGLLRCGDRRFAIVGRLGMPAQFCQVGAALFGFTLDEITEHGIWLSNVPLQSDLALDLSATPHYHGLGQSILAGSDPASFDILPRSKPRATREPNPKQASTLLDYYPENQKYWLHAEQISMQDLIEVLRQCGLALTPIETASFLPRVRITYHLSSTTQEGFVKALSTALHLQVRPGDLSLEELLHPAPSIQVETVISTQSSFETLVIPLQHTFLEPIQKKLISDLKSLASPKGVILCDLEHNLLTITDHPENLLKMQQWTRQIDKPSAQFEVQARLVSMCVSQMKRLGCHWRLNKDTSRFQRDWGQSKKRKSSVQQRRHRYRPSFSTESTEWPERPYRRTTSPTLWKKLMAAGMDILDLELTSLECENKLTIVSRPTLTLRNNTTASLKHGMEVPYPSGGRKQGIAFKEAVLNLELTPHQLSCGKILLKISLAQNSPADSVVMTEEQGLTMSKQGISTEVFVQEDEVVMLGGLIETSKREKSRGPWKLKQLPILKYLFGTETEESHENILLLFISLTKK